MKIVKVISLLLFVIVAGFLIYWVIPETSLPEGAKADKLKPTFVPPA